MTKQEIITLIEGAIVANGTNDITADVLRPVLVSMATQINDAVGSLANLDTTTKDNIVNALNEMFNLPNGGGITILTGTANPNTTAPPVVSLGDFYNRTFSGNTIEFYIFNGVEWVLLMNVPSNSISANELFYFLGSVNIPNSANVAYYNGNTAGVVIGIPSATSNEFREITIVNTSPTASIETNINFVDLNRNLRILIPILTSFTLKSDGFQWVRIR